MKRIILLLIYASFMSLFVSAVYADEKGKQWQQGAYLVVEGKVEQVRARSLVIDGQPYPISMFVRVFDVDEKGRELAMQMIANIGKIDLARLYILGGKVEKIIVLKNI